MYRHNRSRGFASPPKNVSVWCQPDCRSIRDRAAAAGRTPPPCRPVPAGFGLTPLGGILTFASLVQEELPKDSPIRGDVEEVVRQADRCRRIVQELLEFSRQREAHTAPHSINEIVGRTLTLLEKQASFHDIRIELFSFLGL